MTQSRVSGKLSLVKVRPKIIDFFGLKSVSPALIWTHLDLPWFQPLINLVLTRSHLVIFLDFDKGGLDSSHNSSNFGHSVCDFYSGQEIYNSMFFTFGFTHKKQLTIKAIALVRWHL